jgi:DNA (cytosine-5)-methyltransferase 1
MRHGSLFSGIGGFDLAAEWMGWENVFHCEWNSFGQKVLHHYWPQAIQYHDITQTDFTIHRGDIDILTGGFPCQPYSMAGKRLGKEDERHLWPEMLRAIREIAPKYVVGENVLGLTNWNEGLVFDEVHSDLESAGYEVQAVVIPAAAVNAPHGRDRVFFVAKNTMRGGCTHGEPEQERTGVWKQRNVSTGSADGVCLSEGLTTNTDGNGQHRRNREHEKYASEGRLDALGDIGTGGEHGLTADTECRGQPRQGENKRPIRSEENSFGETGRIDLLHERSGVSGNWDKFPTQPPVCGGDDGLSRELDGITFSKWRNESIKAYGNAVVPQVVYQIFKAIQNIT